MSPILKFFPFSVEKLAFLVDSTAAPVSSINLISSWVGVQSSIMQRELDKIAS
jgi:Na+/H+ antiporter NhaC